VGIDLPALGDDRPDIGRREVVLGDLEEDSRPPVLPEDRGREADLLRIAVVEGDHDRLRRQRPPVVPGVLDLVEGDPLIAVRREPGDLFAEFGP